MYVGHSVGNIGGCATLVFINSGQTLYFASVIETVFLGRLC